MGIADVGEKIVVVVDEPIGASKYLKEVGNDRVSYTPYIEEALTFMDVKTAESAIKTLLVLHSDVYRSARGSEAFDDADNRRTIAAVRISVTRTPLLSTVLVPKE